MAERRPVDFAERQAALDPARSFIVQAPAGSGKTGLLTQRFLRLLTTVEQPEEVVAITFTRKAAAEMRRRILQALAAAQAEAQAGTGDPAPDDDPAGDDFARQNRQLARAALAHAEARGWNLVENPQRLRIRTIDSLCQYIARQMPLRSGFGDAPAVTEQAEALYRAAARSVLAELEGGAELADALAALLDELDNDLDGLQVLIAGMLARRDQWLRHVARPNPRQAVERALRGVVEGHLRNLRQQFPAGRGDELARLARYAAANLPPEHPLAALREADGLPPADLSALSPWNALAELLLTQAGEWRRSVNVNNGFPTGKGAAADAKRGILDLLEALGSDPECGASLREALQALRALPEPGYADADWALLQALFNVLLAAVAHLRLVFSEQGQVDFCEIALAAQEALGGELEPTELALRLDYGIRHLLVDEFQDTSQNQFELFRRLTAGWQPGDGRTLFLVGDPMQSIYGFREAEVGLFLDAWQGRLGTVALQPLQLRVNFRSERGVIDWVNAHFPAVFPARGDKASGAVPYAPSAAFRPAGAGPAVHVHPCIGRDDAAEATRIVELIRAAAAADPADNTAVLVRNRAHLDHLIFLLRGQGLRFQAVEIGPLAQRPAVLDLLSLTQSLLHPGDRVSWLALLRGPLCGLDLADLHRLTGADAGTHWSTLPGLLFDVEWVVGLSPDGRARVAALRAVLGPALEARGRRPLRDWVEGAWLALGGPVTLPDDGAADDVEVFFGLLQELEAEAEAGGAALTPERLREAAGALFSLPDPQAGEGLQLMTIHKAKGLEFDTVILPGLGKTPRGDSKKLLYWLETTDADGAPELFFGPVKSARADAGHRTSDWIRAFEAERGRLESGRLLYVATTRAKKKLHLLGHAKPRKDGSLGCDQGSLLARLWPVLGGEWEAAQQVLAGGGTHAAALGPAVESAPPFDPAAARPFDLAPAAPRWRLPAGWSCPQPPPAVGMVQGAAAEDFEAVIYEWAGDTARAVGTVVHRWLQRLGQAPELAAQGGTAALAAFEPAARRMLLQEGVPAAELEPALRRVRAALDRSLQEERGRWILSAEHAEAACEVPLTALIEGQVRRLVVDRTFVDAEGTRWIIDYKTGTHEGGDIAGFLDREQERYRAQLVAYATAFRALEDRPLRTALYFPLVVGGWREVAT